MKTLEKRVNGFFRELRKEGFVAKRNVRSCCRSCVDLKAEDDQPTVWSFGGQGHAVSIVGDSAYFTNGSEYIAQNVDAIYLYHDGLFTDGKINEHGAKVTDLMRKNGLSFELWHSESKAIVLNMK